MEEATTRSTGPIIAGVVGIVALALVIVGALVVVDHINIPGTHQAAAPQQQSMPVPIPAPAAVPDHTNRAPSAPEKKE